jgi:hypothetical protein
MAPFRASECVEKKWATGGHTRLPMQGLNKNCAKIHCCGSRSLESGGEVTVCGSWVATGTGWCIAGRNLSDVTSDIKELTKLTLWS